jgi:hypothetical protein
MTGGKIRAAPPVILQLSARCTPIANVIKNAKNSALYDLIVSYGSLNYIETFLSKKMSFLRV